ncbi:MAG TPA: MOSC domain-containing protein, partial [Dehalococcoidia bacterium]
TPVDSVRAEPGRGLEGDRYHAQKGTYSGDGRSGREVTLIASEAIEALDAEFGIKLGPGQSRRNVTTRGIDLNDFVDRELRVGEVLLRGTRLCEPCQNLEDYVGQPNVIKALVHRGGLRCDIVSGGTIRVGDDVAPA